MSRGMTPKKNIKNLSMPWERAFGYVQGVQVGDTIYISGQLSHDDHGNMVEISMIAVA